MSEADNRTRILYVDTGISIAGGQISLIEILKLLDTSRFAALVCSPAASQMRAICERQGVAWLPLPFETPHLASRARTHLGLRLKDALAALYGVLYLAGVIRKNRIDIVHANNFKAALVGGIASVLAARPMIFHDRIHIKHGLLGWLVALLANRIIVVSQAVGAKHGRLMRRKVSVVHDGIDVDRFRPRGERRHTNRVCCLGRISDEKGIIRLVEAAPAIVMEVPEARFVIGGAPFTPDDKAYFDKIKQRIDESGLSEQFELPGYVDDVPGLLEGISVFALPSKKEPLGLVVMEAMALEKPVVAFDIGGPQEIISNNDDGILVPPGDVDAFARAIVNLLKDPEMASRMGRRGRQTVIERFSNRVFVDNISHVYDEIS